MIAVPELRTDGLRHLIICSYMELEPGDDQLREFFKKRVSYYSKTENAGEVIYFRRFARLDEDGEGHLHIEMAVADVFSTVPPHGDRPEQVLTLEDEFESLNGVKGPATITGRYKVDPEDDAVKRIAKSLLGISLDVNSYELTLNSCTFSVSGNGPLSGLRLAEAKDSDKVHLELMVRGDIEFGDGMAVEGAQHVADAYRSLGSPPEPKKVDRK
jgi:hypothetical protein